MKTDTTPELDTRGGAASDATLVRLTILAHPDLTRMGRYIDHRFDQTLFVGRTHPEFSDGRPLDDRYVSRDPCRFQADKNGVRVLPAGRVMFSGARRNQPFNLRLGMLVEGTTVRLGRVLLHIRVHDGRDGPAIPGWLGVSPEREHLKRLVVGLGRLSRTVLVSGPPESDRENVVRELVRASGCDGLVELSLASIRSAPDLHEVLGAPQDGVLQQARGGWLWLRDLDFVDEATAATLVPVLEPSGADPMAVRIVATVKDEDLLSDELRHQFEDLIPLRAGVRAEDVVCHLRTALTERLRGLSREHLLDQHWLTADVVERLLRRDWSGPREVARLARRIAVESPDDRAILPADVGGASAGDDIALYDVLERNSFRVTAAAKELRCSPNTIRRRMAEAGMPVASELTDAQLEAARARTDGDLPAMARRLSVSLQGLRLRLARQRAN